MGITDLLGGVDVKKLRQVIDLVWDNRDDLADSLTLARKLPDLLGRLADGLAEAGGQARAASLALVGDDGASGARATLDSGAGSLGNVAAQVGRVAQMIEDAAKGVGKVPLLDGPAERFSAAADTMSDAMDNLGDLAEDLIALAGTLGAVGQALGKLGDHLDGSAGEAKGLLTT